jgi:hypothetical protein
MSARPPVFEVKEIGAHRDDGHIAIDIRTLANLGFVFTLSPHEALALAHDLERAFHQHHPPVIPPKKTS